MSDPIRNPPEKALLPPEKTAERLYKTIVAIIILGVLMVSAVSLMMWSPTEIVNSVSAGSSTTHYERVPARLPHGVRAGIIKLGDTFSQTFRVRAQDGEDIIYQVVKGGLRGQAMVNGKLQRLILRDGVEVTEKSVDITGTVCTIAFRNTEPGQEKELAYWISITKPPENWFEIVVLSEEH